MGRTFNIATSVEKPLAKFEGSFRHPLTYKKNGVSALVKGKRVNDDHALQHGQTLEFIKESGSKGLSEL
jgi:hypothetical protein